ncbi:MAG: tetratricopeptide repeat protein [Dehalococcoidia bacterium]
MTRISTGDTAGACVSLEALVDAEPQNAVARAYLGVAYLRLTRVADAREALEQAVKLAPSSFICRAKYGEFLARLGFYDQALTQLDAALAVPPPNTESRLAALELRQHCRDKSRGLYYRPLRYPKLSVPFRRRAQRSVTLQGY